MLVEEANHGVEVAVDLLEKASFERVVIRKQGESLELEGLGGSQVGAEDEHELRTHLVTLSLVVVVQSFEQKGNFKVCQRHGIVALHELMLEKHSFFYFSLKEVQEVYCLVQVLSLPISYLEA